MVNFLTKNKQEKKCVRKFIWVKNHKLDSDPFLQDPD